MLKIAVGSLNPVKIKAVGNALRRVYPLEKIEVIGINSPSLVSDQPMSDEEAIVGAKNRAKHCQKEIDADFGFGLEGNVEELDGKLFVGGWVAIFSKDGIWGISGGDKTELPPKIADGLKNTEKELGDLMDELVGEKNTKQKQGAAGILTKGLVPRSSGFETVCIRAFVKFINPELYEFN